jgi:hypothetical protein
MSMLEKLRWLAASGLALFAVQISAAEVVSLRYAALLDGRQLTHSGEPIALVLRRLNANPNDANALSLLDPLLEPYAFVMPDWLDARSVPAKPWFELGGLYAPGSEQPAWAELLRARRFLVESDGAGRLRLFLPAVDPALDSKQAWDHAWPVIRHVLSSEQQRLNKSQPDRPTTLSIEARAYRHAPAQSAFELNPVPFLVEVLDTGPLGDRPPLDLAAIESLLSSQRTLEGGRLEPNGTLTLLSSERGAMRLLGRPLSLADVAVAYRAIFHGGLAEPYMSLDRGDAPQLSLVNYGGRLRDTSLGLVSLLCDIRFKTFSLGFDPLRGEDVRSRARGESSEFRTHFERFALDPRSAEAAGQQTRLWFYPDTVDLTLSSQADLLALRSVRMSAASERLGSSAGPVPEWTQATVAAINRDYDALARAFPELADLDTVVRWLSFFTWLRTAQSEGLLTPDLDVLLRAQLPAEPTPRRYPQQLAFGAYAIGATPAPVVFDRLDAAVALDRLLSPSQRPLPAKRRFARALGALDPAVPDHAALAREIGPLATSSDPTQLDEAAARAERLRMHRLVLATNDESSRQSLQTRTQAGEKLRFLSLGIGGLDLGMSQVFRRAQRRTLGLAANGVAATPRSARSIEPLPEWKTAPAPIPALPTPAHGESLVEQTAVGNRVVLGRDGPGVVTRLLATGSDRKTVYSIERYQDAQFWRYRFESKNSRQFDAVRDPVPTLSAAVDTTPLAPVAGTAFLELTHPAAVGDEAPAVRLRLTASDNRSIEAPFPRTVLQRLVLGRGVDLAATRPLGGLAPLPEQLGRIDRLFVMQELDKTRPPWELEREATPGEEDPVTLAAALNAWWAKDTATGNLRAVVATDRAASQTRWAKSPRPDKTAQLLAPVEAFPGASAPWREMFVNGWSKAQVIATTSRAPASVVVLVSAEAPDRLSERAMHLARDTAFKGKALAIVSLHGGLRPDLPAALLREQNLSAVGLAQSLPIGIPRRARELAEFAQALAPAGTAKQKLEELPSPFTWYY